jgi:predicted regulator of Ras-like GTPase activity (Roadblock/LC7/MglB family)
MSSVREHLSRFLSVPGVHSVVLVGRDGLLLDAAGRADQHTCEALGALGNSVLGSTDALGQELGGLPTVGAILEYEAGLVSVHPLGDYAALVSLSENAASLGGLRRLLQSSGDSLLRALDT